MTSCTQLWPVLGTSHFSVWRGRTLHDITLHYITYHTIPYHYIHTLHYTTLHYITLHYITLHYIHTYINYTHTYIYICTILHTSICANYYKHIHPVRCHSSNMFQPPATAPNHHVPTRVPSNAPGWGVGDPDSGTLEFPRKSKKGIQKRGSLKYSWGPAWWYTYPSEKYESQWEGLSHI